MLGDRHVDQTGPDVVVDALRGIEGHDLYLTRFADGPDTLCSADGAE